MPCQLHSDCLNCILENLEGDKITLHSCLLVNRLWCNISVRILWKDIWSHDDRLDSTLLSTLIACLPNESKELLQKNKIFISTPTLSPPLFNYATFCRVLSIDYICSIIDEANRTYITTSLLSLKDRNSLVTNEILKMFMNHSSLKKLTYCTYHLDTPIVISNNILFTTFPGAKDCLTDLSELRCFSSINSEIFSHLSQICHKIQSFEIEFDDNDTSNELKELISSQHNLKSLNLSAYGVSGWRDIIPALMKHSDTLTDLQLLSNDVDLPLSFISSFSNLQKITFGINSDDFKVLQYVTFPKLQSLTIFYDYPNSVYMIKFLENNGKNLTEFYTDENDNDLNLSVAKFCPNLKKLLIVFIDDELDTLKTIFNSCQYLESIEIWCGGIHLSEKEVFESVAKCSPKNFHELEIHNYHQSELLPNVLESFFISWNDRIPKKQLSLIIVKDHYDDINEESLRIIEKYKNSGIIKKFETKAYNCPNYLL